MNKHLKITISESEWYLISKKKKTRRRGFWASLNLSSEKLRADWRFGKILDSKATQSFLPIKYRLIVDFIRELSLFQVDRINSNKRNGENFEEMNSFRFLSWTSNRESPTFYIFLKQTHEKSIFQELIFHSFDSVSQNRLEFHFHFCTILHKFRKKLVSNQSDLGMPQSATIF